MRLIELYILLGLKSLCFGQTFIKQFNVQETNEKVILSWTTRSGFTCEDIEVQHRTDSQAFKTVYTFLGSCGSEDKEVDYTYVFEKPVYNSTNSFRLNLGAFGYSDTVSIDLIAYDGLKPKVVPSPSNLNSVIFFRNDNHEVASVQIIAFNGVAVSPPVETSKNFIGLSDTGITAPGVYLVHLQLNGISTYSKFIFID